MAASSLLQQSTELTGPFAGGSIHGFTAAMREEERLILDLIEIMRTQRGAVARDDLGAVDDSVFATHRMLVTLREAQHRRQHLVAMLCEGEAVAIHELETRLGLRMTPDLSAARDALCGAAERLSAEVAQNRTVLQRAMEANEAQIRVVTGAPASGGTRRCGAGEGISYGAALQRPGARPGMAGAGGAVLDRRA